MDPDGAEDATTMKVDETGSAERGEAAIDAPPSHLSAVQESDNRSLVERSALSEAISPLSSTPALAKEVQHDISTNAEPLTEARPIDVGSSSRMSLDQAAVDAVPADTKIEEQPEQDAQEDYGDEDGGVIRCICECDDDDGFTIQCDRCLVWQHCACFGMSQASVPDEYHCEQCDPRPVDVQFARAHQQKRREAEARKASLERSIRRHNQNAAALSSAPSAGMDQGTGAEGSERKGQQGGISRSRKPSQQIDLSNVNFIPADGPPSATATPGSARSYKRRGGAPKSVSRKPSMVDSTANTAATPRTAAMLSSMGNASYGVSTPSIGRADDRPDPDEIAAERMEAWQVEYTPTSRNIITEESVLTPISSIMRDYQRDPPLKAERRSGNRHISPVVGRRVKLVTQASPSNPADSIKEISYRAEHGLTPIGNECVPVEIDSPSLSDCTQRTYVKLISEIASASIFNSLMQVAPLPSEPQRPWSASRAFSKPVMHGLFADVSIPAGCFISEYVGEIGSADTYRQDPVNQYQSIGTTKPGVHLFPPPFNLSIDARRFGNTTRFARFSCHPNAVLRPIILKTSREEHYGDSRSVSPEKPGAVKFGLFAIADIPRTHEITLGWEWDDAHIVHLLPMLVRDPMLGILPPVRHSSSATHSSGNQRLLEREKRHAAIAALVEKGDFPYAGLPFSQKMNSVLTVLLGSCLCACIGSAPSSGNNQGGTTQGSTASSNNMKRQDCAISQMLRLSQGMSLLNVYVPGGSNITGSRRNKIKAPDFEPLIGKRRWWRPNVMPLTPTSIPDDQRDEIDAEDDFYRKLRVPFKLLPGGKVGRVQESDFDSAIERDREELLQRKNSSMQEDDNMSEAEEEEGDSDGSVLTVPLGQASDLDDDEQDEDDSLILQDNNVTIAKGEGGASYLTRTALPPKKRVSGTRLKAVNSAEEDSDVEYKGRKKRKDGQEAGKGSRSKVTSVAEGQRKKKKKKAYEPSSPLTSAPSQENSDESDASQDEESQDDTPTPQQQSRAPRKSIKREGSNEVEAQAAESNKRKKGDTEAKKKALLAKKRRRELLGDLDNDSEMSSNEANSVEVDLPTKKQQAKAKAIKQVLQSDESEAEEVQVEGPQQMSVAEEKTPIPEASVPVLPTATIEPPPIIEIPKAKLSLAEYKKRLAEKKTASMNSISTPLSTPGLAMASPEKMSLPNTPSAASASFGQAIYSLPASSAVVSEPVSMVTTPTVIKSEFAPPAPRFPRPMIPPRDAGVALQAPENVGTGAASTAETTNTVLKTAEVEGKDVILQEIPAPPLASPSRSTALEFEKRVPSYAPLPSSTVSAQSMDLDDSTERREDNTASSVQEGKATETSSAFAPPVINRPFRSQSLSKMADEYPSANVQSTSGASFNPPKAPRALANPTTSTATSPPGGPVRYPAAASSISPYETQQRPSLSSYRQPSPSRQSSSTLASPSIAMGSPYTSAASLNDFANVPKGPARMREREREREYNIRDVRERDRMDEREFREPIPPPRGDWDLSHRDRDWERERERERRERGEREREYLEASYRRDRSHSFDRRRLEEEDDLIPPPTRSVASPYVPRGGMGRGGFTTNRGIAPWAGRARTRGRGSRGAWR
jgi:hypothetical protein